MERQIVFLFLCLPCIVMQAQIGGQQVQPMQTSLQQAANVTVSAYTHSSQAQRDKQNIDDLMAAMMLAGMLPDNPEEASDLGDPEATDNDENANRRNQRERRRRNDQRRRNNRNRQQRNDDNNRTRTRYDRNKRRIEDDASPTGALV